MENWICLECILKLAGNSWKAKISTVRFVPLSACPSASNWEFGEISACVDMAKGHRWSHQWPLLVSAPWSTALLWSLPFSSFPCSWWFCSSSCTESAMSDLIGVPGSTNGQKRPHQCCVAGAFCSVALEFSSFSSCFSWSACCFAWKSTALAILAAGSVTDSSAQARGNNSRRLRNAMPQCHTLSTQLTDSWLLKILRHIDSLNMRVFPRTLPDHFGDLGSNPADPVTFKGVSAATCAASTWGEKMRNH